MPTVLVAVEMGANPMTAGAAVEPRRAIARRLLAPRAEVVVQPDLPEAELRAALPRVDVVLISGFPRDLPPDAWRAMGRLRMVQTLLAGVDHLPYDRFPPRVTVCSNAGAFDVSMPEHAIALVLAAAKNVVVLDRSLRTGEFDQSRMGLALQGATMGIIGLGGIGAGVAARAKALGMRVLGLNRTGRTKAPVDFLGTMNDLERILRESDVVVLAVPLTKTTVGLIGARELGWMKPTAILVNVARGKLVREADLYDHLRAHPGFRAALDVWWQYPRKPGERPFSKPFHELSNVVMTPHIGWAVPEQAARSFEVACENIARFLDGEPPRNVVDRRDYDFAASDESSANL